MTMGERIKQLRSAKGFTQEMLAEKMNVSRSAIAKWEADGGIPDVDNLIQLSFVFNISVDELVGNSATTEHSKRAETTNYEVHDFGSQLHDIELSGWNDACLVSISLQKIRISYTIINHQINHAAYME